MSATQTIGWYPRNLDTGTETCDLDVEEALFKDEHFFADDQFSLYREVPAGALRSTRGETVEHTAVRIPYLLCRGREVVMAFQVMRDGYASPVKPGVPGLELKTFWSDEDSWAGDFADDVMDTAEQLVGTDSLPGWQFSPIPIPTRQMPAMARAKLLRRDGRIWSLEEYGKDFGLLLGCTRPGAERCKELFYAGENVREAIECLLRWGETITARNRNVPLDQRLAQARQGVTLSGAALMRQLARWPLADYLQHYPKDLAYLREVLELGEDVTFGETAAAIGSQLRTPVADPELMRRLAKPLVEGRLKK